MHRVVLGSLLSFAWFACAQKPVGDVFESGGAGAETPAQAVQALYKIAATITGDPSSGYDPKTNDWPEADAAWQQWGTSIRQNGNALTQQQREGLVPCAAHLGTALDSAERGYRIQISQQSNSAAQPTVQRLYATARSEFAQCNLADALKGSNGNLATGGTSSGSQSGGTSGGGLGASIQGGVSTGSSGTPGMAGGGGPGTPQTPGTQSGTPPGTMPEGTPPGSKGVVRENPPPGQAPAKSSPPDIPAIEKAMSACLTKKLPYLAPLTLKPSFLALASAPASARAAPFDQLPGESQVFLEETAMGLQAMVAHNNKYGENDYNDADSRDYLVGWLDDCLLNAGLQQDYTNDTTDDPRQAYGKFLSLPMSDQRVEMFNHGYQDGSSGLPPLPLTPPETPSQNPGVLPLKPGPTSGSVP